MCSAPVILFAATRMWTIFLRFHLSWDYLLKVKIFYNENFHAIELTICLDFCEGGDLNAGLQFSGRLLSVDN